MQRGMQATSVFETRYVHAQMNLRGSKHMWVLPRHYDDVIMGAIASQISSLTDVYSTVYSDADQRKHQSSASLAFVWGIHRGHICTATITWRMGSIIRQKYLFQNHLMSYSTLLFSTKIFRRAQMTCILSSICPWARILSLNIESDHPFLLSLKFEYIMVSLRDGRKFDREDMLQYLYLRAVCVLVVIKRSNMSCSCS